MSNATLERPAVAEEKSPFVLPPLYSLVTDNPTPVVVADVLMNTCRHEKWAKAKWQDVPARPEFLRTLGANTPHKAVVKSGWTKKEGKGDAGYQFVPANGGATHKAKSKSVEGFVWVDVDPIAILANKYNNLRSCHTLDGGYDYRVGNIAHLYCPYMFSVFAGKSDPTDNGSLVETRSSATGKPLVIGGKSAQIRDFQATANVYFLRDSENRPYLYIPRVYDSCAETPWMLTILDFLAERCAPYGIGVTVGSSLYVSLINQGSLCYRELPVKEESRNPYTRRVEKTYYALNDLRSPDYVFGTGAPQCVSYYGDGINYCLSNETNNMVAVADNAMVFLHATGDGKDDFAPLRGSGTLRTAKLTATFPCAVLAEGFGASSFWRVAGTDERVYRGLVQEAARYCGAVLRSKVKDLPRLGQLTSLVAVVESNEGRGMELRHYDRWFARNALRDADKRERALRLIPRVKQFAPLFAAEWNAHKQTLLGRYDDELAALRRRKASAAAFLRDLGFAVQETQGENGHPAYSLVEGEAPPAELAVLLS